MPKSCYFAGVDHSTLVTKASSGLPLVIPVVVSLTGQMPGAVATVMLLCSPEILLF